MRIHPPLIYYVEQHGLTLLGEELFYDLLGQYQNICTQSILLGIDLGNQSTTGFFVYVIGTILLI